MLIIPQILHFSIVSWLTTLQMSNTPNRHWSEISLQIGVWVHKNVNQVKLNLNHSKSLIWKVYSIGWHCSWKCWTNGISCRTSWNDHFVWISRLKWCPVTKGKTLVAAQSIRELNDDSDLSCPYTFSLLAQQDDDNFRPSKIISQGSQIFSSFLGRSSFIS